MEGQKHGANYQKSIKSLENRLGLKLKRLTDQNKWHLGSMYDCCDDGFQTHLKPLGSCYVGRKNYVRLICLIAEDITELPSNIFEDFINLDLLIISGFDNLSSETISSFKSLRVLFIENITEISRDLFKSFTHKSDLSLTLKDIGKVQGPLLDSIHGITDLKLKNIKRVNHDLLINLVNLKKLSIESLKDYDIDITHLSKLIIFQMSNMAVSQLNFIRLPATIERIFIDNSFFNNPNMFANLTSLTYLMIEKSVIRKLGKIRFLKSETDIFELILQKNDILSNSLESIELEGSIGLITLEQNSIESFNFSVFQNDCLYDIKIKNNTFINVPTGEFNFLPNLKSLEITNNNIQTLNDGIFDKLTNLENLTIESNRIHELPSSLLFHNKRLNTVFISFEGTILNYEVFTGLNKLNKLILHAPNIKNIHKLFFADFQAISSFELVCKNLESIPSELFNPLHSLEILELRANKIKHFPENVFDNLISLKSLYIRANKVNELPDKLFEKLSSLLSTNLILNGVTTFPKGIFNQLQSLDDIQLYFKNLVSLNLISQKPLLSVTSIAISGGKFMEIPKNFFNPFPNLRSLSISNSTLKRINSEQFSNLTSLRILNLERNKIEFLDTNAFQGLHSLAKLDLSFNNLTDLSDSILKIKSLKRVFIAKNQDFRLDKWIVKFKLLEISQPIIYTEYSELGDLEDLEDLDLL